MTSEGPAAPCRRECPFAGGGDHRNRVRSDPDGLERALRFPGRGTGRQHVVTDHRPGPLAAPRQGRDGRRRAPEGAGQVVGALLGGEAGLVQDDAADGQQPMGYGVVPDGAQVPGGGTGHVVRRVVTAGPHARPARGHRHQDHRPPVGQRRRRPPGPAAAPAAQPAGAVHAPCVPGPGRARVLRRLRSPTASRAPRDTESARTVARAAGSPARQSGQSSRPPRRQPRQVLPVTRSLNASYMPSWHRVGARDARASRPACGDQPT